jgi:hypothetical protein
MANTKRRECEGKGKNRGSKKSRDHRRRPQLPNLESGVVLLLLSSSLQCISGGVFFFRLML